MSGIISKIYYNVENLTKIYIFAMENRTNVR